MAAQGGCEVVVQRVVRDVGGMYSMLTQYNYVKWAVLMEVMLQARDFWEAVDLVWTTSMTRWQWRPSFDLYRRRWCACLWKTVKQAWAAIKMMCACSNCARKASAQRLRKEYEMISFHDGESVDDFAMHLFDLIQ